MAQLAQRINMRQLPPIIFPHTSSPSISSLARYARLTTHFQWYPVMIVIDMIGMTVISQAPRNSSTTRKSSSLCSLVGFRVRFRIWQGLQMTKMPHHLLHISQYRVYIYKDLYINCHVLSQNGDKYNDFNIYNVYIVYVLNIFRIDIWTLVQSLLVKKNSTQYFCQPYLIYLMPQAPRNSSITKKGSGRSLVGFRVRFLIWQSLQMTKMRFKSFKKYSFCIHMAYNVYILKIIKSLCIIICT